MGATSTCQRQPPLTETAFAIALREGDGARGAMMAADTAAVHARFPRAVARAIASADP